MPIEIITPRDEQHWLQERTNDLTSTEMPALFGMSPYATRFELWHRKRGATLLEIADNERMRWGRRLEAVIAHGIAEDRGWTIKPLKVYVRDTACRMGASFDFEIIGDPRGPGVLEIKNVDLFRYLDTWTFSRDESGRKTVEAPAHIEVQLQAQLTVLEELDYRWGVIAAFVGGNTPVLIERTHDAEVAMALRSEATAFWRSIEDGHAPEPMFPDDAQAVIRQHWMAEPGTLADLTHDARAAELAAAYLDAQRRETLASDEKESCKAELLQLIGDREKAICPGGTKISAAMVAPSAGTLITPAMVGTYVGGRKGYRAFRVTAPKGAK